MEMEKDIERILLSEEQIASAVTSLANQLNSDFVGKIPIIICVLKGSVVFFSDLIRKINFPCQIDFIIAKSYGMTANSSGNVNLIKDLDMDIEGRDILLVEDIIDTAHTFYHLVHILARRNPASLKTITLLDKTEARKVDFTPDYSYFHIENEFVVGYGLDYAEQYRQLPYIGVLKKEVYQHQAD